MQADESEAVDEEALLRGDTDEEGYTTGVLVPSSLFSTIQVSWHRRMTALPSSGRGGAGNRRAVSGRSGVESDTAKLRGLARQGKARQSDSAAN